MASLKEEIRDVIELFDDPEYVGASKKRQAQMLAMEVTEAACYILKGLSPDEADASIYDVIEVTEMLYDEYLVPIDLLPGDFIEDFIEQVARPYISDGVMRFFNYLNN